MRIVFLDEMTMGNSDLSGLQLLGQYIGYPDTKTVEDTIQRCKDANIIISNKVKITAEVMDSCPHLQLICIAATGMNNVDLKYAQEKNIQVKNVSGYSTHSVSEATFSLLFAIMRKLTYYDRYVKSGNYAKSGKIFNFDRPFEELHGKKWGIIGMGTIGKKVASLAEAFGCNIVYYSTTGNNTNAGYPCLPLNELVKESDIISIHCPLNRTTYDLIKYEHFLLMKPTAIIINVARGKIINEADLAKALNENLIGGAGLDVFAHEPIEETNPLLSIDNPDKIVLTPHIAWAASESVQRLVNSIRQNIIDSFPTIGI